MKNILIVDDSEMNLKILDVILVSEGYNVKSISKPKEVVPYCEEHIPDLILSDIQMPEMSGFEVCKALKANEKTKNIPVIFISALSDPEDVVNGFTYGAVDYITKPFKAREVKARVSTHLNLHDLQEKLEKQNRILEIRVAEQVKQISDMQMATIFSLAKLAQSRDDDTGKHLERVQEYCFILSVQLAKDSKYKDSVTPKFIENIVNASPLHDIGKVGISDLILLKPGPLTDEEYAIMKTHTKIGAETLESVDRKFGNNTFIEMGKVIARSHHEKWDGTGYPDRLVGNDIPLAARIMAIADVFDAISTKRSYKDPFPHERCIEIIKEGSGTQFDPDLVEAFLKVTDKFYVVRQKLSEQPV